MAAKQTTTTKHESPTRLAYRRKYAKTHPETILAQRLRYAVKLLERNKIITEADSEMARLAIMMMGVES